MSRVLVEARALTWTPDGARAPVLAGVDLRVEAGERVLLVGPSGSGKSTLLRAIAGVLHVGVGGEQRGELLVGGRPAPQAAASVGLLLQDPRDARVAETVGRDVAFGCENLAMPRERIAGAVAAALEAVHFPYPVGHDSGALSGGEAQRLALAGVIAARPDVLLLDEPTSMLDPQAAAAVRAAVHDAVRGTDCALIVVEHRLDGWTDLLDRVVVLGDRGTVFADGAIGPTLAARGDELAEAGIWVPGRADPRPLPVPAWLVAGDVARAAPGDPLVAACDVGVTHAPALRFAGARRSPEQPLPALAGVDATVRSGSVLALRGSSGAGKSTLVSALCGLVRPSVGRVEAAPAMRAGLPAQPHRWRSRQLAARIGWVPQDVSASVVGATVRDCLLATVRALRDPKRPAPAPGTDQRAESLAELLGLAPLLERNPYRLSGGEGRRLAVACGLLHGPSLVCLDEPTVGQARRTWAAVAGLVLAAREAGSGVVVSTHDDALAGLADESLRLVAGRVVA